MSAPLLPRVTATVDLSAVRHNLGVIRALAPRSKVMAAIKADAYGHGAVEVARTLAAAGVDAFAVACLEEAIVLRKKQLRTPIALLEGVLSVEEAREAALLDLELVVHDDWQLRLLEQLPDGVPLRVWFKLDSGMHRLGFPLDAAPRLFEALQARPHWQLAGWMTHLACADEVENPMTLRQIDAFEQALKALPGPRSIGNSAGLMAWPQARADWVRPGLMLYGACPLPGKTGIDVGLRPAMTVESRLIAVHEIAAGETIGYGASYRCEAPMTVGVVAVGYADGFHRCLPTGTPVMIHEQRVTTVGRVSMDMITIDLRSVPQARVGDPVRLWGEGLPAEEVATWAGTLAYELFCGLTNRVQLSHR